MNMKNAKEFQTQPETHVADEEGDC